MRTRGLLLLAVLLVIAGVAIALHRGSGPLPDPEGCSATVANHRVDIAPDQAENATLIAAIGVRRGLPARAVSIALATAYQESKMRNLTAGDRDSVGIFQQRPSQGWGTVEQIRNETYAINAFYDALEKIDGFKTMRITEAAQKVQRSGFPEAYEAHAADARALASALTGYSPGGKFSCVVHAFDGHGTAGAVQTSLRAFGDLSPQRTGSREDLVVSIDKGLEGNRLGWAVAQYAVGHSAQLKITRVSFDGHTWHAGRDSEKGWQSDDAASDTRVKLALG